MMLIRQHIIDALDGRLKGISTANGYLTEAGKNVFPWRTRAITAAEMPGLVYVDRLIGKRPGAPLGKFRWALQIDIVACAEAGDQTPALIRRIVSDVLKAVGAGVSDRWGGHAITTEFGDGTEMGLEQKDKYEGATSLSIFIIYDTDIWTI